MASGKRKRSDASDHSALPDDVSQDFKDALQDLSGNDRYQITNLTIIAKESAEHAASISEVLLHHISTVSPTRKLPALYVLDSIVKNVGTPYTIYLSQNLFKTFMDAYTLVDPQTRKQMESMLKTWKEPVPGSTDKQPVFPADTTRPIDNALIKARTLFIEQQKQQQQQQQQQQGFPTRSNLMHALPPRPAVGAPQSWSETPTPPQHNPYNPPPSAYYPAPQQPYQPPPHANPQIQSPPLHYQPPYQPPAPYQYSDQQTPQQYPPSHLSLQNYPSQLPVQPYPSQPTPDHGSQPNNFSLAALLQASGTVPQPPPAPQAPSEQQQFQTQFPGLEALFKHKGPAEYPLAPTYDRIPTPQPPTSTSTPVQLHLFTPPVNPATLVRPSVVVNNDTQLTISSLKIPRPSLLHTLYGHRPSQCTTCGRRFPATPEGKARKSRHLDAHFRTNMKFTQQESQGGRGVSRSWYLGEVEWIAAREYDDADEPDAATDYAAGTGGAVKNANADAADGLGSASSGIFGGKGAARGANVAERYIKAPTDAAMAKYACPICQEEFSAVWHDAAQEWVWMDAVKVGDKIYHGSCLAEMAKDRGGGSGGVGTPATGGLGLGAKAKVEA